MQERLDTRVLKAESGSPLMGDSGWPLDGLEGIYADPAREIPLWYREGDLVHYETIPWDGEVGGYGFTEWEAPPEEWLPGTYEVQIFVGLDWKVVGQFILQGDSPTPIPTNSLTPSPPPSDADTETPLPN